MVSETKTEGFSNRNVFSTRVLNTFGLDRFFIRGYMFWCLVAYFL